MQIVQDEHLLIADHGVTIRLSFPEALAFHQGDSYWGCAVAFRALQCAGNLLSGNSLWDRQALSVTSGHPGPGVRDTIEYVTRCISRNLFELSCPTQERRCVHDMQFEWSVSDGKNKAGVRLRDDFVPESFLDLLDRINSDTENSGDHHQLEEFKREFTADIWRVPLSEAFPEPSLTPLLGPRNK